MSSIARSTSLWQWSEAIAEQLPLMGTRPELFDVALVFGVGPARNWVNLWKPTIDGLWPWLGGSPGAPADDRIVRLALHCQVDLSLRHEVVVDLAVAGAGLR